MLSIIGWVVTGWIAGTVAEYFFPQPVGTPGWKTVATGIIGSVVGGLGYSFVNESRYSPAGIIWSCVGAVACLAAWQWYQKNGGLQ